MTARAGSKTKELGRKRNRLTSDRFPGQLNDSRDPLLLIDGNGRILWVNSATVQMFPAPARLDEIGDIFPPENIRQILATEEFNTVAVKVSVAEQSALEMMAIVLNVSAGDPDSEIYLVTLRAVGSRALAINQDEEFLITVTHDLKTPLGAIFGYADVLLDTPAGTGMTDKQLDVVTRIRATASRAVEFVRNYQLFAVMQQGNSIQPESKTPQARHSSDVNQIVQMVIDSTWRDDPIAPQLHLDLSKTPCVAAVERVHVERVLANLFTNALKYTPREGQIFMRTWQDNGLAHFSIRNSGSVIPAAELTRIFERFTRASNAKDLAGNGLGLYIVKFILDRVGGSVSVSSGSDDGTTFKVTFPAP